MGDHKFNPQALAKRAAAAPAGRQLMAEARGAFIPKKHIMLVRTEDARTINGAIEIRMRRPRMIDGDLKVEEDPSWGPPPEGVRVHDPAVPLGSEDLDFVVEVVTICADNSPGRLLTADGKIPATIRPLGSMRIDLLELLSLHDKIYSDAIKQADT